MSRNNIVLKPFTKRNPTQPPPDVTVQMSTQESMSTEEEGNALLKTLDSLNPQGEDSEKFPAMDGNFTEKYIDTVHETLEETRVDKDEDLEDEIIMYKPGGTPISANMSTVTMPPSPSKMLPPPNVIGSGRTPSIFPGDNNMSPVHLDTSVMDDTGPSFELFGGSNNQSVQQNIKMTTKNSNEIISSLYNRPNNYAVAHSQFGPFSPAISSYFPPTPPLNSAVYNGASSVYNSTNPKASWTTFPQNPPTTSNSNFESSFFGGNLGPLSWLPQGNSTSFPGNFNGNPSHMPFPFPGGQGVHHAQDLPTRTHPEYKTANPFVS